MQIIKQIHLATLEAPFSLFQLRRRSSLWLLFYLIIGFAAFALVTKLLLDNETHLKQIILDYLFPESWHVISEKLFQFFFESQAKVVLSNLILSSSLVASSVILFPIKEKLSSVFEREMKYPNGETDEFSLWHQALEETRLLLFYLTAQLCILWIGYYPYAWATITSIVLSYLFLFFTFGLDLIAPTLQRHRISYFLMFKGLIKNTPVTLIFGLIYSIPSLVVAHFVFAQEQLSLLEMASILFLVNILFIALAVPAGTAIASKLLPEIKSTIPPGNTARSFSYCIMGLLLIGSLFLHSRLLQSMHHKSQILKVEYSIDWSSFDFEIATLGEMASGKFIGNVTFDLNIKNSTEYDLLLEKSLLLIEKDEQRISTIEINGFYIPAASDRDISITLDSLSDVSTLKDFEGITDNWRIDLEIELWPGIPFIVNILTSDADKKD